MDTVDDAYYLSCYREIIPAGMSAAEHYDAIGRQQGCKPNAQYDPLLHDLWLRGNLDMALDNLSIGAVFPDVSGPEWGNSVQTPELKAQDLQDDLAHFDQFGKAQTLSFAVDDKVYRLVAPAADDFLDRIERDEACSFARLPHGFWDCLSERARVHDYVESRLATIAPEHGLEAIAVGRLIDRACDAAKPDMGVYAENFLDEMLTEIRSAADTPDFFRSVSFKWQPTVSDRVFSRTEIVGAHEQEQLRIFATFFSTATPLYESMIWKRWVFSGHIKRLPLLAQQHPVVLVGAARMRELGTRWRLPSFTQVEIPLLSYEQRYDILDRCKAAVVDAKRVAAQQGMKKPLIMLQGGSLAFWLIARLYRWDPDAFYLDFGQALHVWFLDNRELWMPWLTFHPRLVMENCELDAFYQSHAIDIAPPFGKCADVALSQ